MSLRDQEKFVSVAMPVHNALPYLDEAVKSILGQTHRNFEFVIFDDGSTDGTTERLIHWENADSRIKLVRSEQNLGPAISSNRVVAQSTATVIARMDADDVSHPDRLRRQLQVLDDDPDVGLVASLGETIDGVGKKVRGPEFWRLTRRSWFAPFAHGSIMYRREIFEKIGGYRPECEFWEDQDLVIRFAAATKIMVLPCPLYNYRQSTVSTRIATERARVERAVDLMFRCMDRITATQPYDDLLQEDRKDVRQLDPRVFISIGSLILWSGGRPRLWRRLLSRADLRINFRSFVATVWTLWAMTAPGTLRLFLRTLLSVRTAFAKAKIIGQHPVRWPPPGQVALINADKGYGNSAVHSARS